MSDGSTPITAQDVAARLNNIEYPACIPKDLQAGAAAAGLVIVFGASDDLMEFRGAIHDEFGCYGGDTAFVDAKGLLDRSQVDDDDDEEIAAFVNRKHGARQIEAVWGEEGYSWLYRTTIPHETFEIIEDGEPYCRGIVFSLADLDKGVLA